MPHSGIIWVLEADEKIGLGHWYRCNELAKEISTQHGIQSNFLLVDNRSSVKNFDTVKEVQINRFISRKKIFNYIKKTVCSKSLIVLDLMNLSEIEVKEYLLGHKTITIGGSGPGRNLTDVRIEGKIVAEYVNTNQKVYSGPDYIIIRKDLLNRKTEIAKKVSKILICLGGDADMQGIKIANLLNSKDRNFHIDVLVGPFAKFDNQLGARISVGYHSLRYPELLRNADIAITAGGMTSLESMYVGTPQIFAPTNLIQKNLSDMYQNSGYGYVINADLKNSPQILLTELSLLLKEMSSPRVRSDLSTETKRVIDGRGLERVVDIILLQLRDL